MCFMFILILTQTPDLLWDNSQLMALFFLIWSFYGYIRTSLNRELYCHWTDGVWNVYLTHSRIHCNSITNTVADNSWHIFPLDDTSCITVCFTVRWCPTLQFCLFLFPLNRLFIHYTLRFLLLLLIFLWSNWLVLSLIHGRYHKNCWCQLAFVFVMV